eukprot:TRINITY_DN5116_c0_g2_i5.p1 TRINITY_DN5116_c0_g2~~TRINITY_DN5116_c0_g2_i5.p1  ORF type:complete len:344 (-),score=74.79 TRINITY_DN5116_c0_g2_i5:1693-2724(-)
MSTHPVAKAIQSYFNAQVKSDLQSFKEVSIDQDSFQQVPGAGVRGTIDGKVVAVGTYEFVAQGGLLKKLGEEAVGEAGVTRVYVGLDGEVVGSIDVVDEIRSKSKGVVEKLRDMGLDLFMLSGDRQQTAETIARKVGFQSTQVQAQATPEGKVSFVENLMQKKQGRVAMVGDGINDTAALAVADVGMAMGGGVDAAGEVADVVLLRDDPTQVLQTITVSKMTMDKIRQNLAWAFTYNVVCIPLAAGAFLPAFGWSLTPSISGALMGTSSLAVMSNSLLLQWQANRVLSDMERQSADQKRSETQKLQVIVHANERLKKETSVAQTQESRRSYAQLQSQPVGQTK